MLYRECVKYLLGNGWGRDGDDPGIWLNADHTGLSFGDALTIQLARDNINFEWTT